MTASRGCRSRGRGYVRRGRRRRRGRIVVIVVVSGHLTTAAHTSHATSGRRGRVNHHGRGRGCRCLAQYGRELVVLEQVLLEFGQYVLAVGELAQRVYVRTYLVHEYLALRRVGHVDHFLHDIIGVLIFHHRVQTTVCRVLTSAHFLDENGTLVAIRMSHTLFDHIRGELVLRKQEHTTFQLVYNARLVLRCAMLEHMLNHIVAVLILHEAFGVLVQLLEYRLGLLAIAMLEYTLYDTTSVRMRGQVHDLLEHVVHNEIDGFRVAALDALLNHVIAVLIFDALDHVTLELACHLNLRLRADRLERFLYHSTAVHLQRQIEHVATQALRKRGLLIGRTILEKLLNDIVAKHVRHERVR